MSASVATTNTSASSAGKSAAAPSVTPPRPKEKASPKKMTPAIVFEFHDSGGNPQQQPSNQSIERVLMNESSSYLEVSKVCVQLLCSDQSSHSSNISQISVSTHGGEENAGKQQLHWLSHCVQQHTDRTCRIRAATTLAAYARRLYTLLRTSPLLYAQKEPMSYEDEVGSDVATLLCMAALEDTDDGVAAACLAALGHLIGSGSVDTFGGLYEGDILALHVRHLQYGTSPYAPSLRSIADEDVGIALQELAVRVMEHVLAPRLLALVERVVRLRSPRHIATALPCVTMCCVHLLQVYPLTLFQMERSVYSKRWSALDVAGAIDVLVTAILFPMLQQPSHRTTAAQTGLQFAQALPERPWVPCMCRAAVRVFQDAYVPHGPLETNATLLAVMMVALRVLPIAERTPAFLWMAEQWCTWPSTVATPVPCAGLHLGKAAYRRPTRMSLWTELAISFFLDGPASSATQRSDGLRHFLTHPSMSALLNAGSSTTAPLLPRDELLLACTGVAIEAGRRLRLAADGMTPLAAPDSASCTALPEWLALASVVLTSFADCALLPVAGGGTNFLDETLSVLNAGLANYVQLLQEYMHCVGLLYPSTSVALKLGANACPPHILWDRLSESAAFLAKLDATILESPVSSEDHVRTTSALVDALVRREMQGGGIPSHHMRLFVLALAADHWVQCRISVIRKQHLESITSGGASSAPTPEALNVTSGREILTAIAPKRLLAKILQAHVPPVSTDGKPRRDPIKKLALESARVSVAGIENMALMVCDWRRRFGSSSESKLLVSIAVGLLQGKMDDTPVDDSIKSVMGPLCEAAVGRIQSFYESSGPASPSMDSFPLSELVLQPVKIKIKPLVSASKPSARPRGDIMQEYFMQLYRQIVASRIQLSTFSCPPAADALFTPARGIEWLRVTVPPVPPSRDGRIYGCRGPAMAAWDHSVQTASAPSDPIQLIVAYTVRRYLRYDGDDDYRLTALVRAFNMTPIDIIDGLRLELSIAQNLSESGDPNDSATMSQVEALAYKFDDLQSNAPLSSVTVEYKQDIKAGESVTWEVTLDDVASSNSLCLVPSVLFPNLPLEPEDSGTKWQGDKSSVGDNQSEAKSGEDDFRVTSSDVGGKSSLQGGASSVRLIGEPLTLPPLIVCQPCPLVFFSDRCGDIDSFRFFWFRFQYHLVPLRLLSTRGQSSVQSGNPITRKIAEMASLSWDGEAIPGGVATKLWAFMSLSGFRVFCVLTESDSPNAPSPQRALHVRGDDQALLFSFIGSKASRDSVVSSLVPDMLPDT
jgi:hypothetical protein